MRFILIFISVLVFTSCEEQNTANLVPTTADADFKLIWENQNTLTVVPVNTTEDMPFTYQWDFGDQSMVNTNYSATHRFESVGEYNVQLIISNANNQTKTTSQTILIENTPPQANFTVRYEPFTAAFDATVSVDENQLSFLWKVLDDELSGESIDYIFNQTGTYAIELTVTDVFGQTDSIIKNITITDQLNTDPKIFIASQQDNHLVQLIATNSYDEDFDYLTFEWLINNEVIDEPKLYYQFPEAGEYTVQLTGFDGQSYVSVEKIFTVKDPKPVNDYDLALYQVSIEIAGRCTGCHSSGDFAVTDYRNLDQLATDFKDYMSLRSATALIGFPTETEGFVHSGVRFIAGRDMLIEANVRIDESELPLWRDLVLMLEQDL
ncbi:PKD domain-containing protein [Marinicellulosiphila megalodicopiae]|uniref:PKD domain-containing protein n=1 Tax=Marinicellulosiphila megalodicopiae TaxID=2724896 RepID=UPI003BAFCD74